MEIAACPEIKGAWQSNFVLINPDLKLACGEGGGDVSVLKKPRFYINEKGWRSTVVSSSPTTSNFIVGLLRITRFEVAKLSFRQRVRWGHCAFTPQ